MCVKHTCHISAQHNEFLFQFIASPDVTNYKTNMSIHEIISFKHRYTIIGCHFKLSIIIIQCIHYPPGYIIVLKLHTASMFPAFSLTADNLMYQYIQSLQYGTSKFKNHKELARLGVDLASISIRNSHVVKGEENHKYPTNQKEFYYYLCKLGNGT